MQYLSEAFSRSPYSLGEITVSFVFICTIILVMFASYVIWELLLWVNAHIGMDDIFPQMYTSYFVLTCSLAVDS